MKIVYWCPYVGHVGTIKAVINSARSMRLYGGYNVKIIKNHTEWEGFESTFEKSNIELVDFGLKRWFPNLHKITVVGSRLYMLTVAVIGFFQLARYIQREKPDVLITNLIAIPAILAARLFHYKPKIIASIQGFPKFLASSDYQSYPLWMQLEDGLRKWLWSRVYTKVDLVVCMTESTKDQLIAQTTIPEDLITVVNNPIVDEELESLAVDQLDDSWFMEAGYKRIVAIGRLTKQKDFSTLIKAIRLVKEKALIRVVVLGEGEERSQLENEIEEYGLRNQIRLIGFADNPYVYLKNSDLFVLTSRWEDPGHAILEAAALRIPIVSTNCPSGPEALLDHGSGGELCPVGDAHCLAEKIVKTLEAPDDKKIEVAYNNSDRFSLRSHFEKLQPYLNLWSNSAA